MAGPLDGIAAMGAFVQTLKDMPPAPVVLHALARLVQREVVKEAKRRGPSTKYIEMMKAQGFKEEYARELHCAIFDLETGALE